MLVQGRYVANFCSFLFRVFRVFSGQLVPDHLTTEHTEDTEQARKQKVAAWLRGSVQTTDYTNHTGRFFIKCEPVRGNFSGRILVMV
jgi:hypothetical protein